MHKKCFSIATTRNPLAKQVKEKTILKKINPSIGLGVVTIKPQTNCFEIQRGIYDYGLGENRLMNYETLNVQSFRGEMENILNKIKQIKIDLLIQTEIKKEGSGNCADRKPSLS